MLKTKWGLKTTDRLINRFAGPSRYFGYFCVFLGLAGMVFMLGSIGYYIYIKLTAVSQITGPAVAFVLPFKVKGGIAVPLMYWLISILFIATIHEFGHALIARAHKIRVRYTGPAFFGIIVPLVPAAYVEPDEKQIAGRSRLQQISVYSAGAALNIISAVFFFLIMVFILNPLASNVLAYDGVKIDEITSKSLQETGIERGELIQSIEIVGGGIWIFNTNNDLFDILTKYPPGTKIILGTDIGDYPFTLEASSVDPTRSVLGVSVIQHRSFSQEGREKHSNFYLYFIKWSAELVVWLFFLNLGIGLFNLSPMLPLDGGLILKSFLKNHKYGSHITVVVSFIFLGVLISLFII